jgi:predicted sulfurtransferase
MKSTLTDLGVRGTFLLSDEGYNAQMAIPTTLLDDAYAAIVNTDEELFSALDWNVGKTRAYHPDEFLTEYERQQKEKVERYKPTTTSSSLSDTTNNCSTESGDLARGFPFKKLIVKPKFAVLTDRLEGGEDLDWTDAGPEIDPASWHEELSKSVDVDGDGDGDGDGDDQRPVLLDCRNLYESDLGTFEGAIALGTEKFSESWKTLDSMFVDVPRDQRVLTFCTGGIRCVKVNAYLKQKLGMSNIGRLEKGIIGYEQWLEEQEHEHEHEGGGGDVEMVSSTTTTNNNYNKKGKETLFKGTNFLFDRRRLSETR